MIVIVASTGGLDSYGYTPKQFKLTKYLDPTESIKKEHLLACSFLIDLMRIVEI